jgi:hypothetical protein
MCPSPLPQPLPGNALKAASRAALKRAPALYRGTNLKGLRATKAVIASADRGSRGAYVKAHCGSVVAARTVVVYLDFPAMAPSASLRQGVLLVSRFAGRYRVWAQLH